MKTAAIIAVLCGTTAVSGYHAPYHAQYHAQSDPCQNIKDKKACMDESACVYQMGERKYRLSRKDNPTHHHEEAGKASCQMKHMKDRVGEGKMMDKFGFGGEWDDMECAEAFYLKDCKDLNQHAEMNGSDVPQCAWNHKTGCTNYDGEKRVYDLGPVPTGLSAPGYTGHISMYDEAAKYIGYLGKYADKCHEVPLTLEESLTEPDEAMVTNCVDVCNESIKSGECGDYTIEELTVYIRMRTVDGVADDACACLPPLAADEAVETVNPAQADPNAHLGGGCHAGGNAYIHPDNSQFDRMVSEATALECDDVDYEDREYDNTE